MIFDMWRMTSAATTATSVGTLTLDGLLDGIEKAKRELEQAAPLFAGGALQVRESQYATRTEPARMHKKRRNQSSAYHRRVQKKWVKRWGTKQVPCAYLIDNGVLGLPGSTLVAHPQYVAELRNFGPNADVTGNARR